MKKNVSWVSSHDLCVGCGVCQDACPHKAISVRPVKGLWRPIVDVEKCINEKGCHRCRTVCPGEGVDLSTLTDATFVSELVLKKDAYIGSFINYYSGYSNNHDIRYYGASGGMTTQFLIYLLEHHVVEGAVVTRFCKDSPFMVDTFIARSACDIVSARSSKYCPVTMAGIITQIKETEGRFVIVGLPCHLHGLRKYEQQDRRFKEKIYAHVGLYCSCGRNYGLTDYVLRSRGIEPDNIVNFTYRQGAGMGKMHIEAEGREKNYQNCYSNSENLAHRQYEEDYQNYYLSLRSFFNVRRCMHCIDHFAELSDISFGDLHTGKYLDDDTGISSMVVRRSDLDAILHKMADEGIITLGDLTYEDLMNSQKYVKTKKHRNPAYMKIDKMLGRKVPVYDVDLTPVSTPQSIKGYIVKNAQIFVGKHRWLHWIIRFGQKDMTNWR